MKKTAKRHRGAVADQYQTVIYCGLICASLAKRRTKMTEFTFFIELLAEQMLLGSNKEPLVIQAVQIMRLLASMAEDDQVLVEKKRAHTYYTITAKGFHVLLESMVMYPRRLPLEDSLFIAHTVGSYGPQLLRVAAELAAAERPGMVKLLEPGQVLSQQLKYYDQTIAKLTRRQSDLQNIISHLAQEDAAGVPVGEQIKRLPLSSNIRQTYKINLREAMNALPTDLKDWEVRTGFRSRLEGFYTPYLDGLRSERAILAARLASLQAK